MEKISDPRISYLTKLQFSIKAIGKYYPNIKSGKSLRKLLLKKLVEDDCHPTKRKNETPENKVKITTGVEKRKRRCILISSFFMQKSKYIKTCTKAVYTEKYTQSGLSYARGKE